MLLASYIAVITSAMAKAIFIGINYSDNVQGCQDLQSVPGVYAKSMLKALTEIKPIFRKDQCRFFTDKQNPEVDGVEVDKPTEEKVTNALKSMVRNARNGESLLVYFCGHGANEYQNSRGALKTLREDLHHPLVLYSTELDAIMTDLPAGVNITFLIHACFGGAMFTYAPDGMKGVGLTSVGPDIPSVVRKEPGVDDFTVHIRDEVIKKLPDTGPNDPAWPTYQQVWASVSKIIVSGKTPDEATFKGHAEIYHAPGKPTTDKFLY